MAEFKTSDRYNSGHPLNEMNKSAESSIEFNQDFRLNFRLRRNVAPEANTWPFNTAIRRIGKKIGRAEHSERGQHCITGFRVDGAAKRHPN